MTLERFIEHRRDANLPSNFGRLGLPFNILEAVLQDLRLGLRSNAAAGLALCSPPVAASLSPDARRAVRMQMPNEYQWKDLCARSSAPRHIAAHCGTCTYPNTVHTTARPPPTLLLAPRLHTLPMPSPSRTLPRASLAVAVTTLLAPSPRPRRALPAVAASSPHRVSSHLALCSPQTSLGTWPSPQPIPTRPRASAPRSSPLSSSARRPTSSCSIACSRCMRTFASSFCAGPVRPLPTPPTPLRARLPAPPRRVMPSETALARSLCCGALSTSALPSDTSGGCGCFPSWRGRSST